MHVWGVWGLPSLPWEGSFQKRMSSGQKGKSEKAKRGFGVWSFVYIKREGVNSECFRKMRADKEGIY